MRVKTLTLGLKRDVRLAKYNVSQCSAQMSIELDPGDDDELDKHYKNLHEDLVFIVEEMIQKEREDFVKQSAVRSEATIKI